MSTLPKWFINPETGELPEDDNFREEKYNFYKLLNLTDKDTAERRNKLKKHME